MVFVCDIILAESRFRERSDITTIEKDSGDDVVDVAVFDVSLRHGTYTYNNLPGSVQGTGARDSYMRQLERSGCTSPTIIHVESDLSCQDIIEYLQSNDSTWMYKPLSAGLYENLVSVKRDKVLSALREHDSLASAV